MPKKPTVRVMLCGGLGNQLFQYAFGRALALRSNATLMIDAVTLFQYDKVYKRQYSLAGFHLNGDVQVIFSPDRFWRVKKKFWDFSAAYIPLTRRSVIGESITTGLTKDLVDWSTKRSITLLGYWQSPRYFEAIHEQLQDDLQSIAPVHRSFVPLHEAVQEGNSVAVHIRRVQYSRVMDMDYYLKAMELMRSKLPECSFFIFSDDPKWCQQTFAHREAVTIVEPCLSSTEFDEFQLMRCCRHFIISVSTFSWWAAWLGAQDGSFVIAPPKDRWDNPYILDGLGWMELA